ncbi:MAG TPA: hypothetical protein VFE60_27395, partial [Roseiarcus sp.]|nr:hypothetical protein [Roseiarcus sp.]
MDNRLRTQKDEAFARFMVGNVTEVCICLGPNIRQKLSQAPMARTLRNPTLDKRDARLRLKSGAKHWGA